MKDGRKTKGQVMDELAELRQRVADLGAAETERERAERALLAAAEQWRSTFDAIGDGVFLLDAQGRVLRSNAAMTQLLGKQFGEITGRTCWELVHGTSDPAEASPFVRAQQSQRRKSMVLPIRDRWFNIVVDPIVDEEGTVVGAVYIMSDKTARKQAEEALRESEERYRALFQQSRDAINITTRDGQLVDANQSWMDLLGYTREEMIGLDVVDTYAGPDERRSFQEEIERKGAVRDYEVKLRKKDGAELDCLVTSTVRWAKDGSVAGYQGVIRDITERKQAEEGIRQRTEDLTLSSSLNEAVNRGDSLQEVIQLLSSETRAVFSSIGATVYLLGEDKQYLVMQNLSLAPATVKRIEKLIGVKMPAIRIPLKPGSLYLEALQEGKPQVISAPDAIQSLMTEFTESKALRKLIPKVYRMLGIGAVMNIPLVSEGEAIGLLDLSRDQPFTDSEVRRLETLAGQLTTIVQRKRAEEATKLAHAELHQIFSTAGGGMRVIDRDFNQVRVNEAFATLVGMSKDDMLGKRCYEVFPSAECHTPRCALTRILAGEERIEDEVEKERNDGIRIPCILTATPFHGAGGELIGAVEDFKDITERKRAEEALRESEQRYRDLVELSPDAITIHSEGEIVFINRAGAELLGAGSPEELVGRPVMDFLHPDYRDVVKQRVRAAAEEEERASLVEEKFLRLDGTVIDAEVAAIPFTYQGKPAVQAIARDITERKRAEEEIRRRTEELAAVNAVAEIVSRSLDLDQTLGEALEKILELMEVETGLVYLFREETDDFWPAVHRGVPQSILDEVSGFKMGQGLSGRAAESGEVLVVEDVSGDERDMSPTSQREGFRAFVAVPLSATDRVMGVMSITTRGDRQFSPQDVAVLTAVGNRIGAAIESAGLYKDQMQRVFQMDALRKTTLDITKQLELDALLESIASRGVQLLRGAAGGLYLHRPERDVLEWVVAIGSGVAPVGAVLGRGEGLSGKVWETGEPLIVDDYKSWGGRTSTYDDYPLPAVVGVPVRWGEKFLGVLNVTADAPRTFSSADAELLSLFANQAAIAIENARLYQEVQIRRVYLETMQRINATLRSTLPLDEVLHTIVDGTANALGYVGALVAVPDPAGERLVFGGASGGKFIDAALGLTGSRVEEFGLPLRVEENPMVEAFLTGVLVGLRSDPEGIVLGVEPAISPRVARAIDRAMGAKSAACVPLRIAERSVGVLVVMSRKERLEDDERAMLLGLAAQAALAIENARLHEQTVRRADEMTALYETSLDISGRLTHRDVLRSIMIRGVELLGASGAAVWLYRPEAEVLEFVVEYGGPETHVGGSMKVGEGLAGKVLQAGEAITVEDYRRWEGRSQELDSGVIGGMVGVPLMWGQQVIGVLDVYEMEKPRRFTQEEVRLLTLFANQAAIAIENARLHEETGRRAEELATLYDVSLDVAGQLELPTLLETIASRAIGLLGGHAGGVYLYDAERQELQLTVAKGLSRDYAGLTLGLGEGVCGRIAESGQPLVVADYSKWEGRSREFDGEPTFSVLGVPIKRGDTLLGALYVDDPDVERRFDDGDIRLATLFANQAAIAIENARLMDEVTTHEMQLRRLSGQLIKAQEQERKRISQELHDELGQALTAMSINLASIEKELPSELAPVAAERMAETSSLIDQALDQVRELALDLRPSMLDDLGLLPTLRWYVDRYVNRTNIETEFEAVDLDERLPPEMETVLYRVVQEALTNVARHADASKVRVHLRRKKSTVSALIEDDGKGFTVEELGDLRVPERGAGLLGMRERVASVRGSFNVESHPGRGTRLIVEIPLR